MPWLVVGCKIVSVIASFDRPLSYYTKSRKNKPTYHFISGVNVTNLWHNLTAKTVTRLKICIYIVTISRLNLSTSHAGSDDLVLLQDKK